MISNDASGILEKIQDAVKPLTDTREFDLEYISLNDWESTLNFKVRSSWIEITFGASAIHTHLSCSLIIPSVKKIFIADFLFPALNLNIPIIKGEFQAHPLPEPGTSNDSVKYQAKWDAILRGTGFIEKLHQQCLGIRDNLPEIRKAIDLDHLNQTIQVYVAEYRKVNPHVTESWCDVKESRN